ncbi:MAG TPA: AsmA-like C-terminal region-containing protein [Candidatus Limnocylindria bacterium]|nr:AsmA-like C-terminal region-containing protein [Candidatus Limnocylindria bacterium]
MNPPETPPAPAPKPRSPVRKAFHWCSRCTLVLVGLLLYAFLHLNQIGLPGFVKQPLLEQLHDQGADLDFSRMRLRLGRGIVIEHVNLTRAREATAEQVYAEQLQLRLNWSDLFEFRTPKITAVTVQGGQITIPVLSETNGPPFRFAVENIQARLRFVSAEEWDLEQFEGTCHQGIFRAAGSITNASQLRGKPPAKPGSDLWKRNLVRLGRILDRLTSTEPPTLDIAFHADVRVPERSTAEVRFSAAGVHSEYGRFGEVRLDAELNEPPTTNGQLLVTFRLDAKQAVTPWAGAEALRLDAEVEQSPTNRLPARVAWNLSLRQPTTRWAQARGLRMHATSVATNGQYVSALSLFGTNVVTAWAATTNLTLTASAAQTLTWPVTNWLPSSLNWTSRLDRVHTRWADLGALDLAGAAHSRPGPLTNGWGLPAPVAWLGAWELEAGLALTNAVAPRLALGGLSTRLQWSADRLDLPDLRVWLYGGELQAAAGVDLATRRLTAAATSQFDVHRLEPLLGEAASHWLSQYGWSPEQPAVADARASVILPAWTNRAPDWKGEVLPTLTLAGTAHATNFTYRGISGALAFVPFGLTNEVWTLRGAQVTRPDGWLKFDLTDEPATHDYHFHLQSALDPIIAAPLLGSNVVHVTNSVLFLQPPVLEADIWGRWHEPERIGVRASLAATNLIVRGQPADEFRAAEVTYTNRWLQVRDAYVRQGTNTAQVEALGYDIAGFQLHFTNAVSTLDPGGVTRAVGPKTAHALEPYVFATTPHVILNGIIPTRSNVEDANVSFETRAGGVRWWKLAPTSLNTTVWWRGQTVTLTNIDADFHGGHLAGNVFVNLAEPEDPTFRFDATFTDVQLRSLLADLVPRTNRIEGLISGRLTVNEAHNGTNGAWYGGGEVRLRDGFLWDLPLFGGLSVAFDKLAPGLGQTRFSSGHATFTIKDRLIRTHDLQFDSPTMRLNADGSVDFDARMDATMQAELLRDVPLLGPVIGFALSPFSKLFEYDVRGTLGKPEMEPRYVPSILLAPLRPIQTIKSLFSGDEKKPEETKPAEPAKPEPITPEPAKP